MSNWSRAGPSGYKMPWESMSRYNQDMYENYAQQVL